MNSIFVVLILGLMARTISSSVILQQIDIPENEAVIQSTTCGGILDGLAAAINYKHDEPLRDGEICIWTVRTKLKGTIQFQILDDGFNQTCRNCQLVSIYEMNHFTEFVPTQVLEISHGDYRIYTVNGPLIYIIFTTRLQTGYPGKGFSLLLAGVGEDMVDPAIGNNKYTFNLQHYDGNNFGGNEDEINTLQYPNVAGSYYTKYEIFSLVLQPARHRRLVLNIPAPFRTGYGHHNSYCGSPFNVKEIRWTKSSVRYSMCRSDLDVSSKITGPMPLIVTFYTYVLPGQGFTLNWNNSY